MLVLHNMPRQPDSGGLGMMGAPKSFANGTVLHEFAIHVAKPLLPQTAVLDSVYNHIQPCEACNLLAVSQLQAVRGAFTYGRQCPVPPDLYS